MSAGEYIFDAHGAIWLRFGKNIVQASAMCNWNGYLVIGHGGAAVANLIYANWASKTEVGSAGGDLQITTTHRTPNLDLGVPECDKQIRGIMVVYRDSSSWTTDGFAVQYRIDEAVSSGLPNFTTLGEVVLGKDSKTHVTLIPFTNLSNQGRFFQFQFSGTEHIDILEMGIYFDVLTMKYS